MTKVYLMPYIEVADPYLRLHGTQKLMHIRRHIQEPASYPSIWMDEPTRAYMYEYIVYRNGIKSFVAASTFYATIDEAKETLDRELVKEGYILLTQEQVDKLVVLI
jgi:hypothetical protein